MSSWGLWRRVRLTGFVMMAAWVLLVTPQTPAQNMATNQLAFGETVGGSFGENTGQEWQFEGAARQIIQVDVLRIGGRFTPRVELVAPDGTIVPPTRSEADGVSQTLVFQEGLPRDGTYSLRVLEQDSTSDGFLSVSEYALTLTDRGRHRATPDEGLQPLTTGGRDDLEDLFDDEGIFSDALRITIYGASTIPTSPPYILDGAGYRMQVNNANPISRGIEAVAFTPDGIAVRSTTGAVFFTDENVEELSHLSGVTTITLANGQQIRTDFFRIESVQALDNLVIMRTENDQRAVFTGAELAFLRRGGTSGEGPNAEPINRFVIDGEELQTDLRRWQELESINGELRVFYPGSMRFLSDTFGVTLLESGNSLRAELDPEGTNTNVLEITLPRDDNPLTMAVDPLGMGDVITREGELRVLPLDGREISGEALENVQRLLVEDEAVRVSRFDGTTLLSLPDGTRITTPAAINRSPNAFPADADHQPRGYNNLGTTLYDYTPDLLPGESLLPVNRILGNFVYPVQDFFVPGHSLPLLWSRTYNSMASGSQTPRYMVEAPQPYRLGQMGSQWRHSLQTELDITLAPLGEVRLILPDGSAHLFRALTDVPGRFRSATLLSWTVERQNGLTGEWRGYTAEGLVYHFDRAGRLLRIEDPFGEVLLLAPVPRQMAEREEAEGGFLAVEPYGRRLEMYTNEANQVILARDVQGRTIQYRYSDQQLVAVNYVAADELASYNYTDELLTSLNDVRSPYHQRMSFIYDDLGRVLSYTINADGDGGSPPVETAFDYGQPLLTTESTVVNGEERITVWRYDELFRLTERVLPRPEWVYRYSYDSNTGRLAEIVQPNRTSLRYEIDEYGYLVEFRDPIFAAAAGYRLTYDSPDGYSRRLLRIDYPEVGGQLVFVQYEYLTEESGASAVTETRPITGRPGEIFTTRRLYDERGRLLTTEEPGPDSGILRTEYEYDAFGYVTEISEGNGLRILLFQHDLAGRLALMVDGRGTATTLIWDDDRDRVRRLVTAGQERAFEYDAFGNLIRFTSQDVVTTYEYNGLNQPVGMTDALGNQMLYQYDEAGNLLAQVFEDGTAQQYTYDALNNLTSATSRSGLMTVYQTTVNTEGNRTRVTVTNPAQEQTIYVYDAIGRLREVLFNDSDGVRTQTYGLSYNPLGYLTRIEEPHVPGGRALSIEYDLLGNPLSSSIGGAQTTYSYNAAGWLESITEPNGSTTRYTYDALGNIVMVTLPDGAQQQYRYDENGNLVSFVDALGNETIYTYDDLNRMDSALDPTGNRTNYEYDLQGNLTAIVDPRGNRTSVQYDALGQVTSVLDALGNTTRFEYNEFNQLTRIEPPGRLDIITLTYDLEGNIVSSSQPGNREFLYSRDSLGRIISVTNPLGQSTLYSYNNIGLVGRTVNALGNEAVYTWNGAGRLVEFMSPDGKRYAYAADTIGRLTAITDVELDSQIAVNTRIEYDASGNITAIRRGTSGTIATDQAIIYRYGYDEAGRLVSFQRPEASAPWQFRYDAAGQLIAAVDPLGVETRYEYDASGRLTRVIAAAGTEEEAVEVYEYDEAGNVITYVARDELVTRYEYDANNRLVQVTEIADDDERGTQFGYDERGRIVQVVDPLGNATQIDYDLGNMSLTRFTDGDTPTSLTYRYFFDEVNNLTRLVLPGQQAITMSYNLLGQRVRYIDAEANGWSYAYDSAGRLTQVSDPQGNFVTYEYDGADRIASITYPTGAQETFAYDGQGNLRTVTLPENISGFSEVIRYTFDQEGKLTGILHQPGQEQQTRYLYDDLGRVTQIVQPNGDIINLEYDAQGRLILVRTPDSLSRRSYDSAGRLLSISDGATAYSYRYDGFGNLEALTTAGGLEIAYEYDALGNMTVEDAGEYGRTEITHDALSRPARAELGGETVTVIYNVNGWRTAVERDNGLRTTYAYDENGRILSVLHLNADGSRLDGIFYEYDAVGNIIRITRDDRWSVLFSYNEGQELISERWLNEINQLVYSVNYTYDLAGNRVEQVVRSNQENPVRTLYIYNEYNQLIEEYRDVPLSIEMSSALQMGGIIALLPLGIALRHRRKHLVIISLVLVLAVPLLVFAQDFTDETDPSVVYNYDESGNLIAKNFASGDTLVFGYDSLNRLIRVQGRTADGTRVNSTYAYDPRGRVREIVLNGQRFELIYAADELLAIHDVTTGTERRYYGMFPGEMLLQETPEGLRWLLHDGLGNVRKLATADGDLLGEELVGYNFTGFGVVFTPYGEESAYTLEAPERLWLGQLYDPQAELYLIGARAYDPHLGRFLQRDPVRHDPEGNLYTYAYSSPTRHVDPTGLTPDAAINALQPPEVEVSPFDGVQTPLISQPPAPPDVQALQAGENARILQVAQLARYQVNPFTAALDPTGCDLYLLEVNPVPEGVRDLLQLRGSFPLALFNPATGKWLPAQEPNPTEFAPPFAALQESVPQLQASYAGAAPLRDCPPGLHLPAQPQPLASLHPAVERDLFADVLRAVPMFGILAETLPELIDADAGRLLAERPIIPTEEIAPVVDPPLPGQLTEMALQTEAIYRALLLPQVLPPETRWRTLSQVIDYSPPLLYREPSQAPFVP